MIYKYKIADPNVAGRDATVPYQDFLDGKVASTLLNPWGMALVTQGLGGLQQVRRRARCRRSHPDAGANPLYAYYWAVNAQTTDAAKKAAAFKWVAFLASQPGEWLKNVNFIQPKVGWDKLPEAKAFPFFDVWAGEMLKGKFLPIVPQTQQIDYAHEVDHRVVRHLRRSAAAGVGQRRAADSGHSQPELVSPFVSLPAHRERAGVGYFCRQAKPFVKPAAQNHLTPTSLPVLGARSTKARCSERETEGCLRQGTLTPTLPARGGRRRSRL